MGKNKKGPEGTPKKRRALTSGPGGHQFYHIGFKESRQPITLPFLLPWGRSILWVPADDA